VGFEGDVFAGINEGSGKCRVELREFVDSLRTLEHSAMEWSRNQGSVVGTESPGAGRLGLSVELKCFAGVLNNGDPPLELALQVFHSTIMSEL
jgi:hypothetical protein